MNMERQYQVCKKAHGDDHCSMCGKQFCAVRTSRRIRELAKSE